MKPDENDDWELTEEDLKLIESVVHPKKMTLAQALESDSPLENINNSLSGKTAAQRSFRLLYAAILEVNVSGLLILFDRFSSRELDEIRARYGELGARKLCAGMDRVNRVLREQLGAKPAKQKRLKFLSFPPAELRALDVDTSIAREMERVLLRYARKSIAELAG
jgi:hypothetical protein